VGDKTISAIVTSHYMSVDDQDSVSHHTLFYTKSSDIVRQKVVTLEECD
jgi:hypothetical protein